MHLLVTLGVLIPVALLLFWGWMFAEMTKNAALTESERSRWLWVFVFFNVFGAAVYYATVYRTRA